MNGDELTPSPRRTLLEQGAQKTASRWAERTHAELAREGRLTRGGWPGTVREARGLAANLSMTLRSAFTVEESAWVTKAIYAHAKRAWFAFGEA